METRGRYGEDPEVRRKVRDLIIASTRSEHLEIRTAAFEALSVSFGDDLVTGTPEDYQIDPRYVAALEAMAAAETDPGLRPRLLGTLANLDAKAEAEFRRQRREKAGP